MAWPSTKSDGDTLSAALDWNLIVNNACRKDAQNTQSAGTYDLTGGDETGYRDGTAFNGLFFNAAGCRVMSDNKFRVCIDSDNDSTDQKFEVVKDAAGATGGTALFEVREDGGLYAPSLPTSDPTEAGALWNDSGTLKVSAG